MKTPSMLFFALLACGACVTATCTAGAATPPSGRPNILLIVGDDMGYADVGFHGCKDIPTPHLDALAASGVRFTNGYVSGPYCSPTRAGLLTGRYQQRFGHEFNGGGEGGGLPLTEVTIANRLKTAGYATALVGKWHLGAKDAMHPQQRGFDEFFGFLGGAHSYFDRTGMLRGTKQLEELDYTTDAFGREAVSFIERHRTGAPWFLYLAFNAVHTPMHATDERLKKFSHIADERRRTYAAMMAAMDENIGRVRKALAASGQEQNTLVYFISDNGGPNMPGVTVNGSINLPLRGSKRTTLEGGIRVPYIISWAGRIKPGVFELPAIQLDLNVTALAAAGVEVKPEWKLDGVDLMPFLTGAKTGAPHDVLYWRFGDQMAIRVGDYKLVRYDMNVETRSGKKQPASEVKLYDLARDLGETKNLFATMPDKAKELQARWDAWNATLMKPATGGGGGDDDGDEPGRKKRKKAE
ncbi:sulfatase-like hydrolase/transferase [Horticoccus sp. 23ND18S-11]|uniref:sulfatase-like hydrolase/transferase n=1 Tax=Horticoccus sp. 23ND18S-11 TaxID=3391832 RepID=UPI0039C926E7